MFKLNSKPHITKAIKKLNHWDYSITLPRHLLEFPIQLSESVAVSHFHDTLYTLAGLVEYIDKFYLLSGSQLVLVIVLN